MNKNRVDEGIGSGCNTAGAMHLNIDNCKSHKSLGQLHSHDKHGFFVAYDRGIGDFYNDRTGTFARNFRTRLGVTP